MVVKRVFGADFSLTADLGGTSGILGRSAQRVFVVDGQDDAMKESVARTLARLDLHPVIPPEEPNQARTIIEKLLTTPK